MRQILLYTLVCLVFVEPCFGTSDSKEARLKEIILELESINNAQSSTIDELQNRNNKLESLSDSRLQTLEKQDKELKELANSYRKRRTSWVFDTVVITVASFSIGYAIGRR